MDTISTRTVRWLKLRWRALIWAAGLGVTAACEHASQSNQRDQTGEFEVQALRYQGSPGSVTYPELAADLGYLAPLTLEYVGGTTSGPQDIQATVTGDVDFGGAFNGAIVNLIAAKAPIVSVISLSFIDDHNYQGFYVKENSAIARARDLIGKKVAMNTVGAHSEFMLNEWLARGGLTRSEMKQVTLLALPPLNTEQTLREAQVEVAALGGMSRERALARGGLRLLFSDFELFGRASTASYVLTRRFLRERPKAARQFVSATARALEWARTQPREVVIERMRRIVATRGRGEDPRLVDYWRTPAVTIPGGVISARDFQLWIDWLVKAGQLPAGQVQALDTFTNDLNPYAAHDS